MIEDTIRGTIANIMALIAMCLNTDADGDICGVITLVP